MTPASQKFAQEQLQNSQELLQSIVDRTNACIFVKELLHTNGSYLLINQQFETLFNASREEFLGKTDYDIFPKDAADNFSKIDRQVLESGQLMQVEQILPQADGIHTYLWIKFPLLNEEAMPYAVCGIATDITDRKSAELLVQQVKEELEIRVVEGNTELQQTVTRLEQQIEEHKKAEARQRQLFEKSADAILIFEGGVFTDCNQAAVKMMRCDNKKQLLCLHPAEISPLNQPDGIASFEKANAMIETALKNGNHRFEWMHRRMDGEDFWVEVLLTAIAVDGKEIIHAVLREIGDRISAEAALRQTEQQYRSIFEATSDGLFMFDLETGLLTEANPAACRMHGYAYQEFLYLHPTQILHPDFHHLIPKFIAKVKAGKKFQAQVLNVRKDDTVFDIEVTGTLCTYNGKPYALAVVRDISDRVAARSFRKIAEKQQQRLVAILEATTDYVGTADANGYCIYLNQAARSMVGLELDQDISRINCMSLIAPSAIKATHKALSIAMQEGTWSGETVLLHRNGQEIPVSQVIMVHKSEAGEVEFLSTIMRDISDRKQAETRLRQQAFDLEQTLRELQRTQSQLLQSEKMSSLGQLVAGVAHEINNPTSFIYGNLTHANEYIQDLILLIELYQKHYTNPHPDIINCAIAIELEFLLDDLPKLFQSMKVGAERIHKIVLSLRTFSRMDEAEMKAVNIHDGIDSTLMLLQHRLKMQPNRPVIEVIKAYGNLPLVECYAGQLNQVFMNILSNAIDALEEGYKSPPWVLHARGKNKEDKSNYPLTSFRSSACESDYQTPKISINTEVFDNKWVIIRIADNGQGMTEIVRQKLFDPFFTTKAIGKGTGMGLSISYQIITEGHKGSLQCISLPGKGAEFEIKIPLKAC